MLVDRCNENFCCVGRICYHPCHYMFSDALCSVTGGQVGLCVIEFMVELLVETLPWNERYYVSVTEQYSLVSV